MNHRLQPFLTALLAAATLTVALAADNPPPRGPGPDFGGPPGFGGPPPFGPGGPGGPGGGRGPGGPGGPGMQAETKLLKQFDKDGDKRLNTAERKAAREFIAQEKASGRVRQRGPRGPRGGEAQAAPEPGLRVAVTDVKPAGNVPFYDEGTVRTLFFEFEGADWEKELADFYHSDVDVPAKLTVDGKVYPGVGVHFRGASSYFTVGEGRKRSLNIAVDFTEKGQNVGGYRTLNLLNSHEDPSFLRTVLYSHIAREYLPAPRANLVRVVVNGESWGTYVSAQQFNKEFTQEFFGSTKGARWKVQGSPGGRGTFAYLGDGKESYSGIYILKTKDSPKVWSDLANLMKVLNETPAGQLEAALKPVFDVDGALRFLALENTLINNDGYWIRNSDYAIYQDEAGRFHLVPHDMNECFARPGGPGFGGGRRGPGGGGPGGGQRTEGVKLDPLLAANDTSKPLISKLLAVPALRDRYLGYCRSIADQWLDWQKLGPLAQKLHNLIDADVKADTRKLDSYEDFAGSLTRDTEGRGGGPFGGSTIALKNFADQRRAYLLEYQAPGAQ